MDTTEARAVLAEAMVRYQAMSYRELAARIGDIDAFEMAGGSGARYQIEIEVRWDLRSGGPIRVIGGIDDGGWRTSLSPLTDAFLLAPDGWLTGK